VDLIFGLVEGVIFGGGRRRGLIRGGLLYLLVDLISGLVEGVIFGGGRRRRSYKRGTTIFGGGRRRGLIRGGLLYFNFSANRVLFRVIYS
jgi:hypothetical protein